MATCFPDEWKEAGGDVEKFKEAIDCRAEEGRPRREYESAKYERFLDSASQTGQSTWRADLVEALSEMAPPSIWRLSRAERRKVANELARRLTRDDLPGTSKKAIIKAGSKFFYELDKDDSLRRTMRDILVYVVA
jgi:hypothetical protein